jgi:hypothetical protein
MIESLENITDGIDMTITNQLFEYNSKKEFGASSFGRDVLQINGKNILCWFGEYEKGYTIKKTLCDLKCGDKYDLIELYIEFGLVKDDSDTLNISDNDVSFYDVQNNCDYVAHIFCYNKINNVMTLVAKYDGKLEGII